MVEVAYALPEEREEIARFMQAVFPRAKWPLDGWRALLARRWPHPEDIYAITARDGGVNTASGDKEPLLYLFDGVRLELEAPQAATPGKLNTGMEGRSVHRMASSWLARSIWVWASSS